MAGSQQLTRRVAELIAQRRRFVQATVVRAQCPTSARPGDAAIVLPDGSMEGFVGGQCAEESVRSAALNALEAGESVLLRVLPGDAAAFPESEGAVTVVNPCLSGGAIEVFLEPKLPAARLAVVGSTPIAHALVALASQLGFAAETERGEDGFNGATAVLVASHGRDEELSVRAALDADVGFIGLVASAVRGRAVIDSLGLSDAEHRRVHSPVGVDIGAKTAEEIALSILAAVVRAVRVEGLQAVTSDEVTRPQTATDPVCGMSVTVVDDTPYFQHDGTDHWFCNPGCRTRFAEEVGAA